MSRRLSILLGIPPRAHSRHPRSLFSALTSETRYSSCLALMDKIKSDVSLDMYIGKHVETLYEQIRSRALIQVRRDPEGFPPSIARHPPNRDADI